METAKQTARVLLVTEHFMPTLAHHEILVFMLYYQLV
jgi:hypothetical protein